MPPAGFQGRRMTESNRDSLTVISLWRAADPLLTSSMHGGGGSRRRTAGVNDQCRLSFNVRIGRRYLIADA